MPYLVELVVADERTDGRRHDEDFRRAHASAADLRNELLADDAFEDEGELRAHGVAFTLFEHVDDAVDGLGGGVGVQGREGQVARLGDLEADADGFPVSHFAQEDDVGVLSQRDLQRRAETRRIGVDFALVDDALLVLVHELDRVLDREDVLVALDVDLVDHGRERRGFAGTSGPGDEDQASRTIAEFGDRAREAQIFEAADVGGDVAQHHRRVAPLHVDVRTEARLEGASIGHLVADAEGEVDLATALLVEIEVLELLLLLLLHHAVSDLLSLFWCQRMIVVGAKGAVDAKHRWGVHRDMEVGGLPFDHSRDEVENADHGTFRPQGCGKEKKLRTRWFG